MPDPVHVEVVLALPDRALRCALQLPAGSTVRDAIRAASAQVAFPALADDPPVGIFSRAVPADHVLQDGDRVEIYRSLSCDPMEARRRRARQSSR